MHLPPQEAAVGFIFLQAQGWIRPEGFRAEGSRCGAQLDQIQMCLGSPCVDNETLWNQDGNLLHDFLAPNSAGISSFPSGKAGFEVDLLLSQ